MWFDYQAVLILSLVVVLMTGLAWLPIWIQNPRHTALLWPLVAVCVFCLGMVARALLPFWPAIVVGNSALLICYGFIWTTCRTLRERRPQYAGMAAPVLVWLAFCLAPYFQEQVALRIYVLGLLIDGMLLLAIREIWLIRRGSRLVRAWLLGVLSLQTVVILGRAMWALTLHTAPNTPPAAIPGIVPALFAAIGFVVLLGPGIVALDKELSDLRYRDLTRNDAVTGIANRRFFEEELQYQVERARKRARPLALIMVDADQFKEYNDLYGHPAGDRCLRRLSQALAKACEPHHFLARYGGEEFAVLLPDTDLHMASAVAQRLLATVRDLRLEHAARPGRIVTVSLGIAILPEAPGDPASGELVEAADRALYDAKRQGRDRACWSGPGTIVPFPRESARKGKFKDMRC